MKVMHYYTYPKNAGGPLTYIENILGNERFSQIEFSVCYQGKAASQIKRHDIKRMIYEIRAFSPDILHVHGVQSEGLLGVYVGKKARVTKILMTVHGLQTDAQNIGAFKKFIFKHFFEPYALRNSDGVYCVCEEMAKRPFVKKHSKNLLPTIHNFITDKFMNKQTKAINIDATGKTIIVTVGRVSYDKGMLELEKVIMTDNNTNVQYWIVGSGEYEESMKQNLSNQISSGKVVFWGQQEDVKVFLEKADIFLFLSHHENLSIALLEAASQNCCCIATDVGGTPEVISNGVDGLLVPAMDAEAASKALQTVVDDVQYRQKLGQKLHDKILVEFGEEKFGERLLAVYSNLYLQGKRKP